MRVNIVDENDNSPVFSQSLYEVTVPEDTDSNQAVLTVNATDADAGDNSRLTYSMVVVDGFYINPQTGKNFGSYTRQVLCTAKYHLEIVTI